MSDAPFVTVIMPIRNEADFIARSLGAVLHQTYPADRYEVLIADGMSTDRTRAIITQTAARQPAVAVTVIDNPEGIVPTGFNRALAAACGDIIIRVDGHTIIADDYIATCVSTLERSGADNVGGRMHPVGTNTVGRAVALATTSPFGVGGARFHYSDREEIVDTVYMGAWRRDVFTRIGLFDVEFVRNQDDEFNYRLRADGGTILLNPLIRSQYYNRGSLRALWRQYFQYGLWKVRVLQKHPRQMQPRQFAPAALVTALLGTGALALMSRWGRRLFALVAGTYIAANLTASLVTLRRRKSRNGWLPLVFATLHLSYGGGFLLGLLRFRDRWSRRRS